MITYEGVDRNFEFLVLEVCRQIDTTRMLMAEPSEALIRNVLSRDNYTDTLKTLIEKKCIAFYRHARKLDRSSANLATAITVSTANLERIADFCVNIAVRIRSLGDKKWLSEFAFEDYFAKLQDVTPQISEAMTSLDTRLALRLCAAEASLDAYYHRDFARIRDELGTGQDTDDLLNCLYIAHYLERMGDALLNIGESILFAITGEKLKLHEYNKLRDAIQAQRPEADVGDFSIDFSWETRSGSRIAKLEDKDDGESEAIFKKGHADKLRKERENIQRWNDVIPGLPPRVLEFRDGDEDAALLLEFLDGYTLRDVILSGDKASIDETVTVLENTLQTAWRATRTEEPIHAGYMRQTMKRLDEVFRIHPEFVNACISIGSLSVASLEELVSRSREAEESVRAPFTVLIHGDLNSDNVIYNQHERKMHVIDLYRTKYSDYVQDISTLLVSNFRLPVLDGEIRNMLNHVNLRVFDFGQRFAKDHGDETFMLRVAFGLARGLITSTRFEFDTEFAGDMYSRAVYLLEKLIPLSPDQHKSFTICPEVVIY